MKFVFGDKVVLDFRNDKRFFLKTQSRREVTFLLSNLQAYMDHLEKYPHSLLVRFLGKTMFNSAIDFYFLIFSQMSSHPDC